MDNVQSNIIMAAACQMCRNNLGYNIISFITETSALTNQMHKNVSLLSHILQSIFLIKNDFFRTKR